MCDIAQDNRNNLGQKASYPLHGLTSEYRRPTVVEELEKSLADFAERSERTAKALAFFKANPVFDEFVTLIRTGCINI